ncbi:MAG: lysophospholipid acyltransferase family protein [Candidatus Poribacteria bacterium]|nr:lysophospholipid acyltransferase family protein [Candidatus Poribacteria bacterium]
MIHAQHRLWADIIFEPYLAWLFKRHFHEIQLLGELPEIPDHLPLLLLPNHSTWWDGFFVYLLNKRIFHRTAYLMMLETQLSKYKFFRKIGAYSIEPENRRGIIASLEYTVELLNREMSLVSVFPQGQLLPWHTRPLGYKRGVEWILEKYGKPVTVLPLAIRTEFLGEKRPSVFFLFGEIHSFEAGTFGRMDWLEETETALLDDLASKILRQEVGQNLLR